MKKLLYIAGEPGSGKSHVARTLNTDRLGVIIHTDHISYRASAHYKRWNGMTFPSLWMLWRHEFDEPHNESLLMTALSQAMTERDGRPISLAENVICEGVLSGHPAFRKIMQEILANQGFVPDRVINLAIDPPWETIQKNLIKRGRKRDKDVEFTRHRSQDYKVRIREQSELIKLPTSTECLEEARLFLKFLRNPAD